MVRGGRVGLLHTGDVVWVLACESEWRDHQPVDVLIVTGATVIDVTHVERVAPQLSLAKFRLFPSLSEVKPESSIQDFARCRFGPHPIEMLNSRTSDLI